MFVFPSHDRLGGGAEYCISNNQANCQLLADVLSNYSLNIKVVDRNTNTTGAILGNSVNADNAIYNAYATSLGGTITNSVGNIALS